jgi:hypothetical protein
MAEPNDAWAHYPIDTGVLSKVTQMLGDKAWTTRTKRGEHLAWMHAELRDNNGPNKVRMFVWWHDQHNQPINPPTGFPECEWIAPPGIVERWYAAPTNVFRFKEQETGARAQSLALNADAQMPSADGSNMLADFRRYSEAIDKLLNEDRCAYMAAHAGALKGTCISDADRAGHAKCKKKAEKDPAIDPVAVLTEKLTDQLRDPAHRGQHVCNAALKPRRKIFGTRRKAENSQMMVSPRDEGVLAMDEWCDHANIIRTHLESSEKPLSLNLMKVQLPDGSQVPADGYGRLRAGAVACVSMSVYGVFMRADGQHTVMSAVTGVTVITNGPEDDAAPSVNLMEDLQRLKRRRLSEPADDQITSP